MINGFVNIITSPTFQNIAQNTTAQITTETSLKAIGRPAFTLMDKHVDKQTRRYAAVKELLYQGLCLGIYLAVIPLVFKKAGFHLFQKLTNIAEKNPEFLKTLSEKHGCEIKKCSFNMFKNVDGLLAFHQLGHLNLAERTDKTNKFALKLFKKLEKNLKNTDEAKELLNNVKTLEKENDYFKRFYMGKGGIEMSSIVGSVIGLTILAPEISHIILHPIMKAFKMDAPKAKDVHLKEKPAAPKTDKAKVETKPLDKKA